MTHEERIVCIFVALIGAIVFSHCMGTVSSLIAQVQGADERYQNKLRGVSDYLNFRGASADAKRRVKRFYNSAWRRSPALFEELQILSELPVGLRLLLLRDMGASRRAEVPLLDGFGDECAGFVLSRLNPVAFDRGEAVYGPGEEAAEMYFVVSGAVDLSPAAGAAPAGGRRVGPGEAFGEVGLFPEEGGPLRREAAVAAETTAALVLSVQGLADVRRSFPEVAWRLSELAALRAIQSGRAAASSLQFASARTPAGVVAAGPGGPYQLDRCIERLKMDILRQRTVGVLLAAACGGSEDEVVEAMRPVPLEAGEEKERDGGGRAVEWHNLSCVVSGRGELLCIEHTLEGIAADRPQSLGFVVAGRSACRILDRSEISGDGVFGRLQPLGCSLRLFRPGPLAASIPVASAAIALDAAGGGVDGCKVGEWVELKVYSWSQSDFDTLVELVTAWIRPKRGSTEHRISPLLKASVESEQSISQLESNQEQQIGQLSSKAKECVGNQGLQGDSECEQVGARTSGAAGKISLAEYSAAGAVASSSSVSFLKLEHQEISSCNHSDVVATNLPGTCDSASLLQSVTIPNLGDTQATHMQQTTRSTAENDSFSAEIRELKSEATRMHQRLSTLLVTLHQNMGKLGQSKQPENLDPYVSRIHLPRFEHQGQLENMSNTGRNLLSQTDFDQQSFMVLPQTQTVMQCLATLDEAEVQLQATRADLLDLRLVLQAHNPLFNVQAVCSDFSSSPAFRNMKS